MDQAALFHSLLAETRAAYLAAGADVAFAPFPGDITEQPLTPYHCPCHDVFNSDRALQSRGFAPLQQALLAASPFALWRETYKGAGLGAAFMDRFGCYSIIGDGGPFTSNALWAWMVYMPAHLDYPWHHHPGEEMYLVVAGEATFRRAGEPDEVLGEGARVFHGSNQPHAMQTTGSPVLCLVFWRNGFDVAPVLSAPDQVERASAATVAH